MLRYRLCFRDIRNHLWALAGLRHALQTKHFDRCRRTRLDDWLARIVEHCTNLAGDFSDNKRLLNLERALLDQHCRHSTTATIEFRFEHDTGGETSRTGAQVQNV